MRLGTDSTRVVVELGFRRRTPAINASRSLRAAIVFMFGIGATGCAASGGDQQLARTASVPPAPLVVEVDDPQPSDYLVRAVVTPVADSTTSTSTGPTTTEQPQTTAPETTEPAKPQPMAEGANDGSSDPRFTIDPELLSQIDENAVLVFRDGEPGFVNSDGTFVSLALRPSTGTPAPPPVATTVPAESTQNTDTSDGAGNGTTSVIAMGSSDAAMVDAIMSVEGVVTVVAIGNGSFAVAAENQEAIDRIGLPAQPDPELNFATEPYEPYQWTFDNTGDNLSQVMRPAPPQVADADIDGREAAQGADGRGVVVAVIDSGVDFAHPDLAGQSWVNEGEICDNGIDDEGNGFIDDCNGWNFGYNNNVPWSWQNGNHGTHVAGIIAAHADNGIGIAGLAPKAKIMDLSVSGPGGINTSSVARAVIYAVDNGADVINMSLGTNPGTPVAAVQPLIDSVRYAETRGVLVVVAAGNSAVDIGASPTYPASIDGSNILTVGASTPGEIKASFSNYGSSVDLFAPGELIVSTVPGGKYVFMSGTSQASPTVAAIAAAVISDQVPGSASGGLSVVDQLLGTADEIPAYSGYAANPYRLNAARALGIDPDIQTGPSGGAQVTISGLALAEPDYVMAKIDMRDPGGEFDEPYHWEASLVVLTQDGVYGVVDHPLSIDWTDVMTDGQGSVFLGPSDIGNVTLETALPVGSYGLVVEAVPEDDPTVRLGDAFIATFDVGSPADQSPSPETGGDPGSDPAQPGGDQGSSPAPTPTPTPTPSPTPSPTPTTAPAQSPGASPSPGATSPSSGGSDTGSSNPGSPAPGDSSASPSPSGGSGGSSGGGSTATTAAPTPAQPSDPGGNQPSAGQPGATPSPAPSPTPTTAPSASPSQPGGQAPASTAPTTAAPSQPTDTTPSPGGSDQWSITEISPRSGPVGQSNMVSVTGEFPDGVYVWFGDQPGQIVHQSENWILVNTPRMASPAIVDVSLRRGDSTLVLPQSYTFFDPSDGQPPAAGPLPEGVGNDGSQPDATTPPAPNPGPGDGSTTTTSPATSPTSSPSPTNPPASTSTTQPATSPDDAGGDDDWSTPKRQSRSSALGPAVDLGNGLKGTPLQGLESVANAPRCASDPCRTRRG